MKKIPLLPRDCIAWGKQLLILLKVNVYQIK